ncbi:hypothetical protein IJ425_02400 [bacterium]|nr:hypothetical protein [bacterium]
MKLDNNSQVNSIFFDKKITPPVVTSTINGCETQHIDEVPCCSAGEVYFRSLLQKSFSGQDVINLLTKNGYEFSQGAYVKDFSAEQRLQVINTLYPNIDQNTLKGKEFIGYVLSNPVLYEEFLKYAFRTEEVCKDKLEPINVGQLTDFANLGNGKVGEFLKNDFEYTLFISKLLMSNNLFDRFMIQAKKQPGVLTSLLQILENKPSADEIKALNKYKSISAFSINSVLRGKSVDAKIQAETDEVVKLMDRYINKCKLQTPMKLIRSDHMGILYTLIDKDKHFLIGELCNALEKNNVSEINKICSKFNEFKPELLNKGYISTSLDFDMGRDIRWELNLKPGVKGIYVDLMNLLSKDTAQENEILLQRDTKFSVTNFKYDSEHKQLVIEADVYSESDGV